MNPYSRRMWLGQAGGLGSAAALSAGLSVSTQVQTDGTAKEPKRRRKIIVTGGHPGDPEYGCGGTIARYSDLGHEVTLLYLNRGEWPPKDEGASRVAEAKKACDILDREAALRRPDQQPGDRRHRLTTTHSARSSRRRTPTPSSLTGRSTITPTIARSRCWPTTRGSS